MTLPPPLLLDHLGVAVGAMSGVLARYYDQSHEFAYFGILGAAAIVVGLVVWVLAPRITVLMEGVH